MSLSYEFSRPREKVTFGWKFTGVVESPYFNKFKDNGPVPLMARFDWSLYRDGVKDPNQKVLSEQNAMKAFSMADMIDGRLPKIHTIPKELVEEAMVELEFALKQRSPHIVLIYPERQMAAANPHNSLQLQMKG